MVQRALLATLVTLLVATVGGPGAAHADLASYSAAVQNNDFDAAASEAAATWPTLDKSRSDISLIAREFAWMSMLAHRQHDAQVYLDFLDGPGAAGDTTPITTRVLKAWMTYRQIGDDDSTAELMTELAASRDAKSADLVAIVAADELADDGVAGAAEVAAALQAQRGEPLSERRRYQLVLLVNNFMKEKRNASKRLNTYSDVVRLDDLLFRDAFHPANRPMRDDLLKVHDETWAWRIALDSVLSSSGQGMTEFTTSHDENRRFEFLEQPADKEVAVLPPCPGTLTGTDDITYPYRASVEMIVAAVVYQFRVDAEGKVADLNILASAPSEGGFSEAVIESAKNWRYVPDEGVDTQTCTMASPMRVGSYQFLLKHREYIDKKKKR